MIRMSNTSIGRSCRQAVIRQAQYIGSFSLSVELMLRKSSSIQNNLATLKAGYNNGKDVILDISLHGITVTSAQHRSVIMSHTLKNISYATCDPASCLFSFMARDISLSPPLQQCHTFRLRTPCQAEELNTLVGSAFRAAYALQMEKKEEEHRITSSRSTNDLLHSSEEISNRASLFRRSLDNSTSSTNLHSINSFRRQEDCVASCFPSSTADLCEYSQVWDQEESVMQDSGISSTSSNSSQTVSRKNVPADELSSAIWYQEDMQRDIAMSVLAKEPLGSFMVRKSETLLGTLALSVRVPTSFHPLGITHYIIHQLQEGYQIKGFPKVHPTLTALITHHSIMPELLPVPLNIHRHNPSFSDIEHDYASLQDFTQLMKDLKLGDEDVYQ